MVYQCLKNAQIKAAATPLDLIKNSRNCTFCSRTVLTAGNKSKPSVTLPKNNNSRPFSHNMVCNYCASALNREPSFCFSCGIHIPRLQIGSSAIQSCGDCLSNTPIQYRSVCAFDYLFPFPEWLSEIKYQSQLKSLKPLSALFSEQCHLAYLGNQLPDLIIPVPLHPNREFVRGFNQTKLFSHEISKHLAIPYSDKLVRRINNTAAQMSLSIKERDKNMKDAFKIIKPPLVKHIALFDDIMTTGSTLRSLAKPLKKAGVQRIDFWSLCRTPKPL